jgi:hypothetical protein
VKKHDQMQLVAPVLLGFLMGRYCPFVVRLAMVVPALCYGYLMVAGRGHGFGQLCLLPAMCYACAVALGLGLRGRRRKTSVGMWQYLDWVDLILPALVLATFYRRPIA